MLDHVPGDVEFVGRGDGNPHLSHPLLAGRLLGLRGDTEHGKPGLVIGDIADHALEALRDSKVREVVVVARRGPLQAAYTANEFHALGHLPGVEVVIDEDEAALDPLSQAIVDRGDAGYADKLKVTLAGEYARDTKSSDGRRIIFRYLTEPRQVIGETKVEGVELSRTRLVERGSSLAIERTGEVETLEAGLVLTSIGYRGRPVQGLPFDDVLGVIPSEDGRVVSAEGQIVRGVYATGWCRRGAKGGLGLSRVDAQGVVDNIVADFNDEHLAAPIADASDVVALLAERGTPVIGFEDWKAIDAHERELGRASSRPRIKLVTIDELLAATARREAGGGSRSELEASSESAQW